VGAFDGPRLQEAARLAARQAGGARFVSCSGATDLRAIEAPTTFKRDLLAFLQDLGS
jgi:hypothetical protein